MYAFDHQRRWAFQFTSVPNMEQAREVVEQAAEGVAEGVRRRARKARRSAAAAIKALDDDAAAPRLTYAEDGAAAERPSASLPRTRAVSALPAGARPPGHLQVEKGGICRPTLSGTSE